MIPLKTFILYDGGFIGIELFLPLIIGTGLGLLYTLIREIKRYKNKVNGVEPEPDNENELSVSLDG